MNIANLRSYFNVAKLCFAAGAGLAAGYYAIRAANDVVKDVADVAQTQVLTRVMGGDDTAEAAELDV